jgi:hypothetical protein
MTDTFLCNGIDDLPDLYFIAGTSKVLHFTLLNASGVGVDMSSGCAVLKIGRFGQASAVISKTGSISGSVATFTLTPSDTISLYGKYQQQPVIYLGSDVYRPSQGAVIIAQAKV